MRYLERRWVVAIIAAAVLVMLALPLVTAERGRVLAAEQRFEDTADAVAEQVDEWFEEHLRWLRQVAVDLPSLDGLSDADAEAAFAEAMAGSIAQTALWLDEDGHIVAAFPAREDLAPGTDMRGLFPHIDAVFEGSATAVWATDELGADFERFVATVVRPSRLADVVSVGFDPTGTSLGGLLGAAATGLEGTGLQLVEPVTGATILEPTTGVVEGEVLETTRPVVGGLLELTVAAPRASAEAAIGGTTLLEARIAIAALAALLCAGVFVVPRAVRQRRRVLEDHARTNAVVQGSAVPTLLLTPSLRIVEANAAAVRLFGGPLPDLVGTPMEELVAATSRVRLAELWQTAPPRAVGEVEFRRPGDDVPGHAQLSLVRLPAHDTVVAQFVDLTDLVRTREALDDSREELRQFAGRVAHDLTNPLTAASGLATTLIELDVPQDQQRLLLGRIARSTTSALELVRRLFWTAERLGAETWYPMQLVDLVDWLNRLHAITLAETRGSIDLDADTVEIIGPEETLRTVIGNLVDNALKYRREGVPPRLALTDVPDDDRIHLVLVDNGSGVPAAMLEEIFEEGATAHEGGVGHGSGLAECRRLVEAVGGEIWAESAGQHGLAFHVTLPRAYGAPVDAQRADQHVG